MSTGQNKILNETGYRHHTFSNTEMSTGSE